MLHQRSKAGYRLQKYLGLPKSLYFNIKYFGFQKGLTLPILLTYKVVLRSCSGTVKILSPLKRGMITIGFTSTPIQTLKEYSLWNVEGEVVFKSNATLGSGTKIAVGINGKLFIGDKFEITGDSDISCYNYIQIGDGCLFSWEILLMDTDGHPIFDENQNLINPAGEIYIFDNVWIGCRSLILKNTIISKNSIVASNSLLNSKFNIPNSLIAGVPATIKKTKLSWKSDSSCL